MWPFTRRVGELAKVARRASVRFRARIVSANDVHSPMTDTRAAFIEWALFAEREYQTRNGRRTEHRQIRIGALCGRELVLEAPDGRVVLAYPGFAVRFDESGEDYGELLNRLLPPEFGPTPNDGSGVLYYRERALRAGDAVELTAVVVPSGSGAGAYRGGAGASGAEFVADYSAERAIVVDRSLDGLR
jgi:hypothetical protein